MSDIFQKTINKTKIDDHGRKYVQVKHSGELFRVDLALDMPELELVKEYDNQFFTGLQKITLEDLQIIQSCGAVLMLCNPAKREQLYGVSQILLSSIPKQEVRPGEAFSYGTVGPGYGQVLYKAQEVIARETRKERIRATVRLEDTVSIRSLMKAGYRIHGYDPTRYGLRENGGARLVMEKDLINEQFPFEPQTQQQWVQEGIIRMVTPERTAKELIGEMPLKIGVWVRNTDHYDAFVHRQVETLLSGGYVGIGLLQKGECFAEDDPALKLLVFQRADTPPAVDRLSLPVQVTSEYGKLREVIVSYTPENAQIRAEYAINDVAKKNVENIDPIAFKDEYNLFVGTLVDLGIKVVHTNAIGKEGKSAIFTRDPAFVFGDTIVLGRLKQVQRHYETEGMRQISLGHLMKDLTEDDQAFLEGGDIIFLGEKRAAVGLGQRTNQAGLRKLQLAFPDYSFVAVPHDDLHLDVLFTMLGPKKCLGDVTRLPQPFLHFLKSEGFTIVEADPGEQPSLGCNVVALEPNKVLAVKENAVTNQRIREHGVDVVEVSMPNIVKWGGGPRCMTCPTHREELS